MEDKVAILSFARGKPPPFAATSSIKELSRSIIEINGSFALSNTMSLVNIVNVFSEDKDTALRVSSPPFLDPYSNFFTGCCVPADQVRLMR